MDAYILLNVSEEADDASIKEAYLRYVQKYSPERHPELFEIVRRAFESIATESDRLNYHLFHAEVDTFSTMVAALRQNKLSPTLNEKVLRQILAEQGK